MPSQPQNRNYYIVLSNDNINKNVELKVLSPNNLYLLPGIYLSIQVNDNIICLGDEVTFTSTISPSGSTFSYTYQWYYTDTYEVDHIIPNETGSTYTTTNTIHNYKYFLEVQDPSYPAGFPVFSNKISMIVTSPLEASVSISNSPIGLICSGKTITFTATPTNGGTGATYQWYLMHEESSPVTVGTNSTIYTGNTFLNNDIVYCVMTSNLECCTISNPATSNYKLLQITGNTNVNMYIESNPASVSGVCTICTGDTTLFTTYINPSNIDRSLFNYTWYINNISQLNITPNNYNYVSNNLASGDTIKCLMSTGSTALSCITISGVSNTITMDVRQKTPVAANITSNPPEYKDGYIKICPYSAVTFTATPTNAISYEWHINETAHIGTSNTYYSTELNDNDQIYCVITSSDCTSPGTSNMITVEYYNTTTPQVSIISSPITIGEPPTVSFCSGGTISLSASTSGDTVTNYYWQKYIYSHWANISDAPNSRYYSTGITNLISQSGTTLPIRCRTKTLSICQVIQNANSNTIYLSLTGTHAPEISITSNPIPPFCTSTGNISFSATTTEKISIYKWQKAWMDTPNWNDIPGSPNSEYFSSTILNLSGNSVRCIITGSTECLSTPYANSNAIYIQVSGSVTPTINIYADKNPICSGMTITFSASTSNEGDHPNYQWYLTHFTMQPQAVGTNSNIYTGNTFLNNDEVYCILTSSLVCVSISAVTSNTVTVDVNNSDYITVTVSASPSTGVCYGTGITLTALASGGSGYLYQWRFWETGYSELDNPAEAHWVDLIGETGSTYNTIAYYDIIYDVVVTTAAGCIKESNSILISVYNIVTPQIIIQASENPICYTDYIPTVTYSLNYLLNQGLNPTYAWWKTTEITEGDTYMGSGTTMSYNPSNGDIISCDLTSSLTCATPKTVRSSGITMIVTEAITPTLSILPTGYTFCVTGSTISFSAITNVGVYFYEWKRRNPETTPEYWYFIEGATNSQYFSTTVTNTLANNLVRCEITTHDFCVATNYANSNQAYIDINGNNSVSVIIRSNPSGSTCSGTTVYFIAIPTNAGSNPSYQWKVNNVNVGTNSINYEYIPNSGDTIKCILNSDVACATGNPATSNTLTMDVIAKKTPSVSILSSPSGETCSGTTVTITATPVNGGTSPQYKWYKQWILIPGETNSTYQYNPSNNDVLECELISNVECPLYTNSVSTPLVMVVNPNITAGILINSTYGTGTITIPLSSTKIDFYIDSSSGSCTTPIYQWYKNSSIISGAIYSTYSGNSWVDGDIIKLSMTGDCACTIDNPAISNTITIDIAEVIYNFIIFTDFNHLNICLTDSKYFWSSQSGYTSPTYEWRLNGNVVGGNTHYLIIDSDWDIGYNYIHCKISESGKPDHTSNTIYINADQKIPIVTIHTNGFENPICFYNKGYVVFNSVVTNGGTNPHYQWKKNNISVGTDNYLWVTNGDIANGDVITLEVTSNATCAVNPGISSEYTVLIDTPKEPSIYIRSTPSGTWACGESVYFYVDSTTYEGTDPHYEWYLDGEFKSSNSEYTPTQQLWPGQVVNCYLYSNYPCVEIGKRYVKSNDIHVYLTFIQKELTIEQGIFGNDNDPVTLYISSQSPEFGNNGQGGSDLHRWWHLSSQGQYLDSVDTHGATNYTIPHAQNGDKYQVCLLSYNECIQGAPFDPTDYPIEIWSNIITLTKQCIKNTKIEVFYCDKFSTYPPGEIDSLASHSCNKADFTVYMYNADTGSQVNLGNANINNTGTQNEMCGGIVLCTFYDLGHFVQPLTNPPVDISSLPELEWLGNSSLDRYWSRTITDDDINQLGDGPIKIKLTFNGCSGVMNYCNGSPINPHSSAIGLRIQNMLSGTYLYRGSFSSYQDVLIGCTQGTPNLDNLLFNAGGYYAGDWIWEDNRPYYWWDTQETYYVKLSPNYVTGFDSYHLMASPKNTGYNLNLYYMNPITMYMTINATYKLSFKYRTECLTDSFNIYITAGNQVGSTISSNTGMAKLVEINWKCNVPFIDAYNPYEWEYGLVFMTNIGNTGYLQIDQINLYKI
jgi:hypothetical protein